MTIQTVLTADRIFDGREFHQNAALLIRDGYIHAILPQENLPENERSAERCFAYLVPGFVDWQVNGGGGVLFNETPTVAATRAIARAHLKFGTTALLPTVITDAPAVTDAAAHAVQEAILAEVPGIVGIHFEGPHLSKEKCGVHEPDFIRMMEPGDLERFTQPGLGAVVVTAAPENVEPSQIGSLVKAGVTVSIGHTKANYETARTAFAAGASAVTHLFNAMAPLHHREPGLVGAAMENPDIWCGLIADGHHIHPAVLRMICRTGPLSRLTLVTDAMSSVGSPSDTFLLNGRMVKRENGRLTVADGTLAGSDLDMLSAVKYSVGHCGVSLASALQMATRNPADMLKLPAHGRLSPGARADILALNNDLELQSIWLGGDKVSDLD